MGAPAVVTKWLTPLVERTLVADTEVSPNCTNKYPGNNTSSASTRRLREIFSTLIIGQKDVTDCRSRFSAARCSCLDLVCNKNQFILSVTTVTYSVPFSSKAKTSSSFCFNNSSSALVSTFKRTTGSVLLIRKLKRQSVNSIETPSISSTNRASVS